MLSMLSPPALAQKDRWNSHECVAAVSPENAIVVPRSAMAVQGNVLDACLGSGALSDVHMSSRADL